MKKVDALYSYLIAHIEEICGDSAPIVHYRDRLDETSKKEFDELCEQLYIQQGMLADASRSSELADSLSVLIDILDALKKLPPLEIFNYDRCMFVVVLLANLSSCATEIPDEDVVEDFGFFDVALGFDAKSYMSSADDFDDNIVWLNVVDVESLRSLPLSDNIELAFALIGHANRIDFTVQREVIFCNARYTGFNDKKNLITLLKLHMISAGHRVLQDISYKAVPKNSSLKKYSPSKDYAQFGEVVDILGELVERRDALSRYLSLYHVIENFMCRVPIVRLERRGGGAMFSIRDFKELYRSVEQSEKASVKQLVLGVFDLLHGGVKFGSYAYSSWRSFVTANSGCEKELDAFLSKLVGRTTVVKKNEFPDFFASVLYQIRCSVVHNKETEFHISVQSYRVACKIIFEQFYLPILEEFVFLLMRDENNLVWYKNDSIALWDRKV